MNIVKKTFCTVKFSYRQIIFVVPRNVATISNVKFQMLYIHYFHVHVRNYAFGEVAHGSTDNKSTLVQAMDCCARQQAITWSNVDPDLCRHMASLGHNELSHWNLKLLSLF